MNTRTDWSEDEIDYLRSETAEFRFKQLLADLCDAVEAGDVEEASRLEEWARGVARWLARREAEQVANNTTSLLVTLLDIIDSDHSSHVEQHLDGLHDMLDDGADTSAVIHWMRHRGITLDESRSRFRRSGWVITADRATVFASVARVRPSDDERVEIDV